MTSKIDMLINLLKNDEFTLKLLLEVEAMPQISQALIQRKFKFNFDMAQKVIRILEDEV